MADIQVINGNMAAAIGAALCRPDIIAAYPITPQTPIVEYLADFVTGGKLDSSVSEVESELSAMSVVTGASLATVIGQFVGMLMALYAILRKDQYVRL